MEKLETVCAVVVTYNRKNLLIECLDALMKQTRPIDAIYLIDNFSNDGTAELLLENGYINELPPENLTEPFEMEMDFDNSQFLGAFDNGIEYRETKIKSYIKIYYVRMNENTGGAGGFYEGVKRGYERGYDWLWLMDDDAEAYTNSLELLEQYFKNDEVVALANAVIKPNNEIDLKHRGLTDFSNMFPNIQQPLALSEYNKQEVEIHTASFVGLLIRSRIVKEIGLPLKEFFIHNDDIEYCLRLMQKGNLLLIPESKIKHKEASNKGNQRPLYKTFWLQYYGRRNLIVLANKYSTNKFKFYTKLLKQTIREIGGILLYDDNKFKRIRFILQRIIDGVNENYDNSKPKRILYK
jgi:GT2 family glycosyltransferase